MLTRDHRNNYRRHTNFETGSQKTLNERVVSENNDKWLTIVQKKLIFVAYITQLTLILVMNEYVHYSAFEICFRSPKTNGI